MKKALTLLLLVYSLGLWAWHASTPLRTSTVIGWMGENIPLPEGGSVIFWRDTILGDYDIYAQRIGANGEPMWAEPCEVVIKPGNQTVHKCILTSDGNYLVTWQQDGTWGQLLSPSGQKLWANEGVLLWDEYCALTSNPGGGAYLVFSQNGLLKAKSLSHLGVSLWTPEVRTLAFFEEDYWVKSLLPDGSGGFVVHLNSNSENAEVDSSRIMHFNSNGLQVGDDILPYPAHFPQVDFSLLALPNSEFLVYSAVSDNNLDLSLCLQKFDVNGNPLLPQPVCYTIPIATSSFSSSFHSLSIKSCNNSNFLVSWYYQVSLGNYQSRLLKLDSALSSVWDSNGITVTPGIHCSGFSFFEDADSAIYCSWKEIRPDNNHRLRAQKVSSSGVLEWSEYGEILDEGIPWFSGAIPIQGNSCSTYVWYADEASEQRIKYQKLDSTGSALLPINGAILLSQLGGYTRNPKTVFLGDRYISFWEDFRPENYGIYYQISNSDMQNLLPENGTLLIPESVSHPILYDVRLIDNNQVAIFYCFYTNNSYRHYMQKMDAFGTLLLPGLGQYFAELVSSAPKYDIIGTDIYTAWGVAGEGYNQYLLKAQRYVAGIPVWETGGKVIASSYGGFSNVQIKNRYFVWGVYSGSNCTTYVKRVDEDGYIAPGWGNNPLPLIASVDTYTECKNIGLDGN
ncbi:MAG: hypothetical protein PHO32_08045, partial [Candidatus Cloacimonetes bacterium]|nr:hypothetical protein [Candidatus Cloacimonadota bacterium]